MLEQAEGSSDKLGVEEHSMGDDQPGDFCIDPRVKRPLLP